MEHYTDPSGPEAIHAHATALVTEGTPMGLACLTAEYADGRTVPLLAIFMNMDVTPAVRLEMTSSIVATLRKMADQLEATAAAPATVPDAWLNGG